MGAQLLSAVQLDRARNVVVMGRRGRGGGSVHVGRAAAGMGIEGPFRRGVQVGGKRRYRGRGIGFLTGAGRRRGSGFGRLFR